MSNNLKSTESQLLRGALVPTLIVGVVSLILSTLIKGNSGLIGSLIAELVVILFFIVHIFISKISRNLDPIATMGLAMFSYFAKIVLMGAAMFAISKFTDPNSVSRAAFGISAIALTFAWLGGEIRAYFKLRVTLPLPKN